MQPTGLTEGLLVKKAASVRRKAHLDIKICSESWAWWHMPLFQYSGGRDMWISVSLWLAEAM